MLNIVICVKQVYDTECLVSSSKGGGTFVVDGIPLVSNPYDLHAVYWAVELRKSLQDVSIGIVTFGQPSAKKVLRECLALGANRALLLSDSGFESNDGYAIGTTLSKAIGRFFNYDIILCGDESIDNNAGWTSAVISDQLRIPLITKVTNINFNGAINEAIVKRKLPGGKRQIVKTDLPCLLTVGREIGTPQSLSLRSIMGAKKQPIERYSLMDLGLSEEDVCLAGAKFQTLKLSLAKPIQKKIFTPSSSLSPLDRIRMVIAGGISKSSGKVLESDTEEMANAFIKFVDQKISIGGR